MTAAAAPEKLPLGKQIAYAIGQLGWATALSTFVGMFVYYYKPPVNAGLPFLLPQTEFMVVLSIVAVIAAIGKLSETILYPWLANRSDRSTNPRGRRMPMMRWAAIPCALALVATFVPPDDHITTLNMVWVLVAQLLFYLFLGMYCMPYNALLIELGHTEKERLNLSTYISLTYALGLILAFATPELGVVLHHSLGISKLAGYQVAISIVASFAAVCMLVPVVFIDEKRYCQGQPSQMPVLQALRQTLTNRKFQQFVFSDMAYFASQGIIEAGLLYYVVVLLGEDEAFVIKLMGAMLACSFLLYPLVNYMAKRMSKKTLIQVSFLVFSAMFGLIFLMGKIPLPQNVQLVVVGLLAGVPAAFLGILPNTVVADISELDKLKTGVGKEAMFFAARFTMMKLGQTFSILIFAGLLNFGYTPGNDFGLRLTGIAGLVMCLLAFIIFQPYSEADTQAQLRSLRGEDKAEPLK